MKERVYRFGPQRSLVGIYTEPSPDEMIPDAPLAVILNAGIVHHIGPFRLHVDLARRLADAGFRTLRLDLSGLGDSGLRAGKMDASQRALLDVRDALDFLQQHHGVQRFVVMGLCKVMTGRNAMMDPDMNLDLVNMTYKMVENSVLVHQIVNSRIQSRKIVISVQATYGLIFMLSPMPMKKTGLNSLRIQTSSGIPRLMVEKVLISFRLILR